MGGINSFLFLKILCDLERKKIDTVPDEEFFKEASEQHEGKKDSPYPMKIYMQEKFGVGGCAGSKRYACSRCSCLFRQKRHLRQHLQFHCNHKCLGCSECYANILKSFKKEGGENAELLKTYSCTSCLSSFLTGAGLAIHKECHLQPDQVFECKCCSQQFDTHQELDQHLKTHKITVVQTCPRCGKTFSSSSNLARHIRLIHQKDKKLPGDHFLAQSTKYPDSDMEHSDEHHEEDDSDGTDWVEASSKACALCKQIFKHTPQNRSHVCPKFPSPESLPEEMFEPSGFQCPACSQIYSSYIALKMHWGAHIGLDPLTCTLCDKKLSSLRKVHSHFELHGRNTCKKCGVFFHTNLGVLLHHCGYTQRCFVCDKVFPSRSSYTRHLTVHPLPKTCVFKCTECRKSFLKESYFRAHQIEHTGTHPFVCSVCDQKFLMYGPFKKHVITHVSNKIFKCKACDRIFRSAKRLEVHLASHVIKTENDFICDSCPLSFKTESAFRAHTCKREVVEATGEADDVPRASGFECHDCGMVFRKQHQLFIHLQDIHGKTSPYLLHCDLCSRGFYHRNHLRSHRAYCCLRNDEERKQMTEKRERTKQNKFGERQLECSKCERKFFLQLHLDNHMYVHRDTSESPYQCSVCGAGYAREYSLKVHQEKCTGEKSKKGSFKCTECGALFQTEKTLDRHTKAHQNAWECSLCKEKFLTERKYSKHKASCTPERAIYKTFRKPAKAPHLYTCPTCQRTYILKDRFEAHVASHQGIKRYQCQTCFHKFMSSNNFKRHKCKLTIATERAEIKSKPSVSTKIENDA